MVEGEVVSSLADDRLRLAGRLESVVRHYSGRDDVELRCLWRDSLVGEAPAWFVPGRGEVTVNAFVGLRGRAPGDVNPLVVRDRRQVPVLVGLVAHEAAHVRYTVFSEEAQGVRSRVAGESWAVGEVMVALEEPRIERRYLEDRPQDRRYLRSQSLLIDVSPFVVDGDAVVDSVADRWAAAMVLTLVWGRVAAGVLEGFDTAPVDPVLEGVLGAGDAGVLRGVVERAVGLADGDLGGLEGCAREWVDVVGVPQGPVEGLLAALTGCGGPGGDADALGAPEGGPGLPGGPWDPWSDDEPPLEEGDGGDAPVEGDDAASAAGDDGDEWAVEGAAEAGVVNAEDASGVLSSLGTALRDARDNIGEDVATDVDVEDIAAAAEGERRARILDRTQAVRAVKKERVRAKQTFARDRGKARELNVPRAPLDAERVLATKLGAALNRAQFMERAPTTVRSEVPPGRLDGREAMLGAAQRARRSLVTARPFVAKQRRRTPEPPIIVGAMCDSSASMAWGAEGMASVAWALSQAMGDVQDGTFAAVTFGGTVTPLIAAGETPAQVTTYSSRAGVERFEHGFASLNGALGLTWREGAKLLVVFSDGQYMPEEKQAAADAVARIREAGGTTLWVAADEQMAAPSGAVEVPVSVGLIREAMAASTGAGGAVGELVADMVAKMVAEIAVEELAAALAALRE